MLSSLRNRLLVIEIGKGTRQLLHDRDILGPDRDSRAALDERQGALADEIDLETEQWFELAGGLAKRPHGVIPILMSRCQQDLGLSAEGCTPLVTDEEA